MGRAVNPENSTRILLENVRFSYGGLPVLDGVNAAFKDHAITAITGPSGKGKSTFLSILNRLWETVPGAHFSGKVFIRLDGRMQDIHDPAYPVDHLRRKVGMVFQSPNPLPMSIRRNVAFPLMLARVKDKREIRLRVEKALRETFLWEEVKDRLDADARTLSGGQQQRLCIARALILEPGVLLLDEPTAYLDEKAVRAIETLLVSLKSRATILMVSHYLEQVRRIADRVLVLKDGTLHESP